MLKQSRSTLSDEVLGKMLTGAIPIVGPTLNAAGEISGLILPSRESAGDSEWTNFIPGKSAYSIVSRLKHQADRQERKHKGHATHNYLSEMFGPVTSMVAPAVAGAAMAKDKVLGALGGLGVSAAANVVSLIAAAISKRRTSKEQVDHDSRVRWENWMIPGVANYNTWKRLGRSEGDYEEAHPNEGKEHAAKGGIMTPTLVKALIGIGGIAGLHVLSKWLGNRTNGSAGGISGGSSLLDYSGDRPSLLEYGGQS